MLPIRALAALEAPAARRAAGAQGAAPLREGQPLLLVDILLNGMKIVSNCNSNSNSNSSGNT